MGGYGGHWEENFACKGEYTKLERDPCNLYNTKFYVWECIIIIGVGWGPDGEGQSKKQAKNNELCIFA